jgi:hypothetical protein
MHTQKQLNLDQFQAHLDGKPAEGVLEWGTHDRLGVVVDQPLGALGASLAIQLAIAEFFSLDHGSRLSRPMYADIYLFHVGGPWGDFSPFDFSPPRREVFLPADAAIVLEAINDRGITHLLVPDGVARDAEFGFKERDIARDRIKMCLTYGHDGQVENSDLTITTNAPAALQNAGAIALDMQSLLGIEPTPELLDEEGFKENFDRWKASVKNRLNEVSDEQRASVANRFRAAIAASHLEEQYRRCSVDWALGRLGGL